MKQFQRIILFFLAFLLIQYTIIFASPGNFDYEMNSFVWSITNALNTRTQDIEVPTYFYDKSDNIIIAIKEAFKNSSQGEIAVKSFYANNKSIKFYYIDDAPIYTANDEKDLEQIYNIATRAKTKDFIVAFKSLVNVTDPAKFRGVIPQDVYGRDEFMVNIFNKSDITSNISTPFSWNYPVVYRFSFSYIDEFKDNLTINKFVAEKTRGINQNLPVKEKVKKINEIIVTNFSYDLYDDGSFARHYPITLIKNKKGVCSAYALLASTMLDAVGVENIVLTGYATDQTGEYGEHMWLMVKDESNAWYHFDPTFNDPIPDNPRRVYTKYSLIPDKDLSEDHSWIGPDYTFEKNNIQYSKIKPILNPTIKLQINNPKITVNNISYLIDENDKNVAPVLVNDTTYLPIRSLVEAVGGSVEWNQDLQEIVIYYKNKTVRITINSNIVQINNEVVTLNNAPFISNNRTLFPLRNIMNILDKNVEWVGETQEIIIK